MSLILELLQYPFMVRALVVGILISICASLLGTSLVLKRYSMIGDSLSHVGFAACASKGMRRRRFFAAVLWPWGFLSFLSPEG